MESSLLNGWHVVGCRVNSKYMKGRCLVDTYRICGYRELVGDLLPQCCNDSQGNRKLLVQSTMAGKLI